MLLATYDKNGPQLHLVDPSGTSHRYFGAAVGKGRQLARNEIEKLKLGEMTCRCAPCQLGVCFDVHSGGHLLRVGACATPAKWGLHVEFQCCVYLGWLCSKQ